MLSSDVMFQLRSIVRLCLSLMLWLECRAVVGQFVGIDLKITTLKKGRL
jgi:hypothetical protein